LLLLLRLFSQLWNSLALFRSSFVRLLVNSRTVHFEGLMPEKPVSAKALSGPGWTWRVVRFGRFLGAFLGWSKNRCAWILLWVSFF